MSDDKKKSVPPPSKKPAASVPPPAAKKTAAADPYRLDPSHPWANIWKIFAGIGVLGLAGAGAGFATDVKRFAFSYLFAFEVALTFGLGTLFFVLIQHLTSAGWSVTVRRTAELLASGLMIMAVLFVPVFLTKGHLFPWLGSGHGEPSHGVTHTTAAALGAGQHEQHGEAAGQAGELPGAQHAEQGTPPEGVPAHDKSPAAAGGAHAMEHGSSALHGGLDPEAAAHHEVLEKKKPYLNEGFFSIRAVVYVVIWALLGWYFLARSTEQDRSKDPQITVRVQGFAPIATILFGLTLTFAGFDWIMSLQPDWFSTIFGVYIFAGCAVSSLAVIILVTQGMRSSGLLRKEINVEHYHDLGKLMFGFLVFWAYIGFSQFMLQWYASLPEETTFFHRRWDEGPWSSFSLALVFLHFAVPFFLVLSRNVKRNLQLLTVGAAWIVVMHIIDIYWLVMPNYARAGFSVHWMDLACLLGTLGVYFGFVFYRLKDTSLIPVGDPRLQRALHFENA